MARNGESLDSALLVMNIGHMLLDTVVCLACIHIIHISLFR